jgi:hypothetical protein
MIASRASQTHAKELAKLGEKKMHIETTKAFRRILLGACGSLISCKTRFRFCGL